MNPEILAYINEKISDLGIDYSFGRKNGKIRYPYFVGQYLEAPEENEGGGMKCTFILSGWTKGSWLDLEQTKEIIAESFRNHTGIVGGFGVAIYYSSSHPIPEEDSSMKRMEITLDIRIWRNK